MFRSILLLAASAAFAAAHMQLFYPPPLKAANNPNTKGTPDSTLLYPHNCCGKTTPMPCRGYLSLLGTSEGAAVASWAAGSEQKWSITGPTPYGGTHYGGSCQVGFSVDQGKSFHVVRSYEGNCPHRKGSTDASTQQFPFTVPSDLPNGDAVFAWTWMNREQEFFMNCAVVSITGGSGNSTSTTPQPSRSSGSSTPKASISSIASTPKASSSPIVVPDSSKSKSGSSNTSKNCRWNGRNCRNNKARSEPMLDISMKHKRTPGERAQRLVQRASTISFAQRPLMLFADVNNGCYSPKYPNELKYPSPGPDVVEGDGEYVLALPYGTCS